MNKKDSFENIKITAKGEPRAWVELEAIKTLWFNTGTLCNLQCGNCYIESSPVNDRLVFITPKDIQKHLDEISLLDHKGHIQESINIGLTGGEPFLNPDIIDIIELILTYKLPLLILTNGTRLIRRFEKKLILLSQLHPDLLNFRISLDHFTKQVHDQERGKGNFNKVINTLKWMSENDFNFTVAGRSLVTDSIIDTRKKYLELFLKEDINLKTPEEIIIFPEMNAKKNPPEITEQCWSILDKTPSSLMCAKERMIVKHKGDITTTVMPCTLLAYDQQFRLGETLKTSQKKIYLNHRFCSEFCVLGGASCSE